MSTKDTPFHLRIRQVYLMNVGIVSLNDLLPMIEHSENPLERLQIILCENVKEEELWSYSQRVERFGTEVCGVRTADGRRWLYTVIYAEFRM